MFSSLAFESSSEYSDMMFSSRTCQITVGRWHHSQYLSSHLCLFQRRILVSPWDVQDIQDTTRVPKKLVKCLPACVNNVVYIDIISEPPRLLQYHRCQVTCPVVYRCAVYKNNVCIVGLLCWVSRARAFCNRRYWVIILSTSTSTSKREMK